MVCSVRVLLTDGFVRATQVEKPLKPMNCS